MADRCKGFLMVVAGLLLAISPPVLAEARYALVIGNGAYSNGSSLLPLKNSVNDAKAVAEALKKYGFEVALFTNVSKGEFFGAVQGFQKKLASRPGQTGLMFYTGHGLRGLDGYNYLIPVGVTLEYQEQIPFDGIAVERILGDMELAKAKTSLLIIDACRDNDKNKLKSKGKGSADLGMQVAQAPEGTLLAFATGPNKTALDYVEPSDPHSPYVTALLEELPKPGRKVEDVLKAVGALVAARTDSLGPDKKQVPSIQSSLFGDFYFVPPPSGRVDAMEGAGSSPERVATGRSTPSLPRRINLGKGPPPVIPPLVGEIFRDTLSDGIQGPWMAVILLGKFTSSLMDYKTGPDSDEQVQKLLIKQVTFALGQREVTVGEFRRFVEATGYQTDAEKDAGGEKGCYIAHRKWLSGDWEYSYQAGYSWKNPNFEQSDDHPVVCVSWNDANQYVEWLSQQMRQRYRLPTEAEWEGAAQAGTGIEHYWSGDPSKACRYANVADQSAQKIFPKWAIHECSDGHVYTAPVGSFQPKGWKLYDMLGNVRELTCSTYIREHDSAEEQNSAEQGCHKKDASSPLVVRGGSWSSVPVGMYSALRVGVAPTDRFYYQGFRLARSL